MIIGNAKKKEHDLIINADPSLGGGVDAPIGTTAYQVDGGGITIAVWVKTGNTVVDWKDADDIGNGGGAGPAGDGLIIEMPTALPDGVANAGKLIKAKAGQAEIAVVDPAQVGLPPRWEITINSVGVAGVPGQNAFGDIVFSAQPAVGDVIRFQSPDSGETRFEFDVDPMNIAPGNNYVEISGMGLAETINQFENAFQNMIMNHDAVAGQFEPNELRITAGDAYNEDQGNNIFFLEYETQISGNISLQHLGGVGEFINGAMGVSGSLIHLMDYYFDHEGGAGGGMPIDAQVSAGNNWVVQGTINDEAVAIAAAIEAVFTNMEMNNYTTVVTGNVIEVIRGEAGVVGGELQMTVSNGNWSGADADIAVTEVGEGASDIRARGPYVGALLEVVGGNARISAHRIIALINEGVVGPDQDVVAIDGKIRDRSQGNPTDDGVGRTITGGADGATSLVIFY